MICGQSRRPGSPKWLWAVPAFALLNSAALPQPAADQPGFGTILFVHTPDGDPPWPVEDIYAIDATGSNIRALTHDGRSHDPAWSADGQHVLFVHDSKLTTPTHKEQQQFQSHHPVELYVMDRNGRDRHLLRRLEPVIYSAAWSPDGTTLAISAAPQMPVGESMRAGLFLLPADGQGIPRLLFRNALTPAWSPDGKRLAFSVEQPRGHWSVHVGNLDGSGDTQLTEPALDGGSPAWSPDGKRIAFEQFADPRHQQVFVMNSDGSHKRQITNDSSWSCGHPSWSADGQRLVFSCRSAANPCGTVSSVGAILPECTRRLFVASPFDSKKPLELIGRDGATPVFSPVR